MPKGKALYKACRELIDDEIVPKLKEEEDDEQDRIATQGAELGMHLLVDVAESLRTIATKVG